MKSNFTTHLLMMNIDATYKTLRQQPRAIVEAAYDRFLRVTNWHVITTDDANAMIREFIAQYGWEYEDLFPPIIFCD